jgi:hypothetical protein
MDERREYQLWRIRADANRKVGRLATRFARTRSGEREGTLAQMQFERWLAETCEAALPWPQRPELRL